MKNYLIDKKKPVLVVDFDNTIAINDQHYNPIEIVPDAVKTLALFRNLGFHIVISSGRTSHFVSTTPSAREQQVTRMREFLNANMVCYDAIDDGNYGKMIGDLYIDDRALGVRLIKHAGALVVDWGSIYKKLHISKQKE